MVRSFSVTNKERIRRIDPILFCCTLFLTMMSILTLYGGLGKFDDLSTSGFVTQVVSAALGFVLMIVLALIDYEELVEKLYVGFFVLSISLLVITLLFGVAAGTNKSYIRIGPVGIQPSEFVKAAYIITLSKHLDYIKDRINSPRSLLGIALHSGVIIGLILLSGDLGVALVYVGLTAVMLFCAGFSVWYFLGVFGAGAVTLPYLWSKLQYYQQQRIIAGFNPEIDPQHYGHQALLSRQAIANGGLIGKGIDGGTYYENLFASHTDFIFATICEKFGFIGGVAVLLALTVMVIRIIIIAYRSRKEYGGYICIGAAAIIVIQTLENTGMCMAFLPVVGITLPFLSYGGSSMLSMYIIIGLVQSIRSHREKYFFEINE